MGIECHQIGNAHEWIQEGPSCLCLACMAVGRLYQWAHGERHVHAACGWGYIEDADVRPPCRCVCKGERSLDGRSAAAVKELGTTLGGEPEEDSR
jgi:hypothetical protein